MLAATVLVAGGMVELMPSASAGGPLPLFDASGAGFTLGAVTVPGGICFVTISADAGRGGAAQGTPMSAAPVRT